MLIHKGTKLKHRHISFLHRLRALLIHKGTKHENTYIALAASLRALLIHKGTKLITQTPTKK